MPDHDARAPAGKLAPVPAVRAAQVPARPAPGSLRWVAELINTRSAEFGTDEIATPALLANWLRDRYLLRAGVPVTTDEHHRTVRMREGLRALAAMNNTGPDEADHGRGSSPPRRDPSGSALADLAGLARRLPLVLDIDGRTPRLMPLSRGTADTVLASMLAAVAESVASGTWNRLKVCKDPGCRWAYYDQSRNRSRAWCSMAACGNRAKARAFRSRAR
jgi:CGNR zinc finger/Putative stress-induced transcription regulator